MTSFVTPPLICRWSSTSHVASGAKLVYICIFVNTHPPRCKRCIALHPPGHVSADSTSCTRHPPPPVFFLSSLLLAAADHKAVDTRRHDIIPAAMWGGAWQRWRGVLLLHKLSVRQLGSTWPSLQPDPVLTPHFEPTGCGLAAPVLPPALT